MKHFEALSLRLSEFIGFPKVKVESVFTPTKAAYKNYIERKNIDESLSTEMSIPGTQIVVYGHSGSGKTSSVLNLLRSKGYCFIKTQCESETTFEQLILNAFDSLDMFFISEKSRKKTHKIKSELGIEYQNIKALIGNIHSTEDETKYSRLLPPQLTPQKLAQFMGRAGIVWVIEDFHKVKSEEQKRIADVLKIFVDNANDYEISKVICIGACQSAHELLQLDPNLKNRVSEIAVPLLNEEEIRKIIINGFKVLRIKADEALIEKLVYYSDRLGTAAHRMCLDICKKEQIRTSKLRKRKLEDHTFKHAIDGFLDRSSDTFQSIYDSAVRNELGWYILKSISNDTKDKLSLNEIYALVNKGKRSFSQDEVELKLKELCSPTYEIIYFNKNSEKYVLKSPFWHRFLKIQLALEKSKRKDKKKADTNPNLLINSEEEIYKMVDEMILQFIKEQLHKTES